MIRACCLLVSVCVLSAPVLAQPRFSSGIEVVRVGVTVLDRDGQPLTDLSAEDFEVWEDGARQEVQNFARGLRRDADTVPLHLGLLLDASGSMGDDDRFLKTAAIKFLNTVSYAIDMTVVDFDTEVRVGRYGQNDYHRVIERIRERRPRGFTALYDALGVYLDGAFEQSGRKVLVLYTDGVDTRSRLSFAGARDLLRASDVTMYAIGLQRRLRTDERWRQRMRLEGLAATTGGRSYFPDELDDLDVIYGEIAAELESRYSLGFVSTNPAQDGTWRDLEIRLRPERSDDDRRVTVHARDGYFAPYREDDAAGPAPGR